MQQFLKVTISRGIGVLALLVGMTGCAGPSINLSTSPYVPAAEGTVKAEAGENKNTRVDLTVKHMAPPAKVEAGANIYVVWAQPTGSAGRAVNLGALNVNKNLEGQLRTVTPLKDFRLFVTAEPSAQVQAPSGQQLLWANVSAAS